MAATHEVNDHGRLAMHLCELPGWGVMTIKHDFVDLAAGMTPTPYKSRQDLLDVFDKNLKDARETLSATSDETWMKPWSLKKGEQVLMTLPKVAVFRTWVMNHNVHHRAQLGVYYRLNDVAVPGTYGPSADEGQM